jgi:hypothetical protein
MQSTESLSSESPTDSNVSSILLTVDPGPKRKESELNLSLFLVKNLRFLLYFDPTRTEMPGLLSGAC